MGNKVKLNKVRLLSVILCLFSAIQVNLLAQGIISRPKQDSNHVDKNVKAVDKPVDVKKRITTNNQSSQTIKKAEVFNIDSVIIAVENMKRYIECGHKSVNNFIKIAQSYEVLARNLEPESLERASAVAEGLKYINIAIEKSPNTAIIYAIKAQILLAGSNNIPNVAIVATYEKMLELLYSSDSTIREKSKSLYIAAYYFCGIYYIDVDKSKATEYLVRYKTLQPGDEKIEYILEFLNNDAQNSGETGAYR